MKRKQRKTRERRPPLLSDAYWLRLVESLVSAYSSKPAKRGKYKGHSRTNTLGWVAALAIVVQSYISARNKGRSYDGNMALAALLGRILVLWYCNVHRAKGFDPARPLTRRAVFTALYHYKAHLAAAMNDERLMGAVWGQRQRWNFPFGQGAEGGDFV